MVSLPTPDHPPLALFPPFAPELLIHVAACPCCRDHLPLFGLYCEPLEAAGGCSGCDDDLAAFIDLERDQGLLVAVAAYPDVWLHLLACPGCAVVDLGVRVLAAADLPLPLPT